MIEIPLGWRRLRDGETVIEGDKCWDSGDFKPSINYSATNGLQSHECRPYIRPLDNEWYDHDDGTCPVNGEEVVETLGNVANWNVSAKAKHWHWKAIAKYRRSYSAEKPKSEPSPQIEGVTPAPSLDCIEILPTTRVDLRINGEHIAGVQVVDDMLEIESMSICKASQFRHLIAAIEKAVALARN